MVGGELGQVHRRPPCSAVGQEGPGEGKPTSGCKLGLWVQGVEWSHRTPSTVMFASAVAFKAA